MNAFVNEIKAENLYFKHALGKSELHGDEFHDHDEIVYYIGGGARLVSRDVRLELSSGSIVFIPREHFHHFTYENEENYQRCILHYKGEGEISLLMREVASDVKVISDPGKHSIGIFEHLMTCAERTIGEREGELLLRSAFTALLIDEKLFGEKSEAGERVCSVTRAALAFIDDNYAKSIDLSDIASAIGVSVSTLSHVFSRELSVSVYKYVTEKRLSSIRALLAAGVPLGEAAEKSGFSDYSAFYRLYKRKYGESPSGRISGK